MENQYIVKRVFDLKPGEMVLGCMRYFQVCHYVNDFPPFPSPEWHEFIRGASQLVEQSLHLSLGIVLEETSQGLAIDARGRNLISAELEFTTIVDHATRRILLDTEGDVWGMELGRRFPHLAEKLFQIALGIPGFIDF